MKKPAALKNLNKLSAQSLTVDNVSAIFAGLKNESDRAVVTIFGSILEDELDSLLRKQMVPLSDDDDRRIFGFDGVAGSFSRRILLAYALGLIDSRDRRILDIVREMRNACAHSRAEISFQTPELRDVLYLIVPESMQDETSPEQLKGMFVMACTVIFSILVGGKSEKNKARLKEVIIRKFPENNSNK